MEEQKELLRRNHDQLIGRTVTVTDILSSINYLNGLGHGIGTTDDIDHLGNRRIRSVGELLQNQAQQVVDGSEDAVSYTHLDVYKRQIAGSSLGGGGLDGAAVHGREGVDVLAVALVVAVESVLAQNTVCLLYTSRCV